MAGRPKPKADSDRPGALLPNGASAKAGSNRSIHRAIWSTFARRVADKAPASGVTVLSADPRHTSQQCRHCGHIATKNRESHAVFRCVRCGHANHAVTNPEENIVAGSPPSPPRETGQDRGPARSRHFASCGSGKLWMGRGVMPRSPRESPDFSPGEEVNETGSPLIVSTRRRHGLKAGAAGRLPCARGRRPVPMYGLWELDPLRRHHHPHDASVPSLHGGW